MDDISKALEIVDNIFKTAQAEGKKTGFSIGNTAKKSEESRKRLDIFLKIG